MSYHEAREDGVRVGTFKRQTVYYPRCLFCGKEVFSYHYLRDADYACRECRPDKRLLLATGLFPDRRKRAHSEKKDT